MPRTASPPTTPTDVSTGDLPSSVNVLEEARPIAWTTAQPTQLPFTDEGRAMLQIVHDVAPGASLAFYTAENSEADFASGIGALAAAGAKVIADDIGYFDEPFFQDGSSRKRSMPSRRRASRISPRPATTARSPTRTRRRASPPCRAAVRRRRISAELRHHGRDDDDCSARHDPADCRPASSSRSCSNGISRTSPARPAAPGRAANSISASPAARAATPSLTTTATPSAAPGRMRWAPIPTRS